MRIAVPVTRSKECSPFETCHEFVLFDVDGMRIVARSTEVPPPKSRSDLHNWLRARGTSLIIATDIEGLNRDRLGQLGIRVVSGAPAAEADALARDYLLGQLKSSPPPCN